MIDQSRVALLFEGCFLSNILLYPYTDVCIPNPCNNGGTCEVIVNPLAHNTAKCSCTTGWYGDTCGLGINLAYSIFSMKQLHIS